MRTALGEELENMLRSEVVELADVPASDVEIDRPLKDMGVDSLIALELVVRVERRFGIRLTEDEIRNIRTIRDMVEFASRKDVA